MGLRRRRIATAPATGRSLPSPFYFPRSSLIVDQIRGWSVFHFHGQTVEFQCMENGNSKHSSLDLGSLRWMRSVEKSGGWWQALRPQRWGELCPPFVSAESQRVAAGCAGASPVGWASVTSLRKALRWTRLPRAAGEASTAASRYGPP
jgi:hypothetical protein